MDNWRLRTKTYSWLKDRKGLLEKRKEKIKDIQVTSKHDKRRLRSLLWKIDDELFYIDELVGYWDYKDYITEYGHESSLKMIAISVIDRINKDSYKYNISDIGYSGRTWKINKDTAVCGISCYPNNRYKGIQIFDVQENEYGNPRYKASRHLIIDSKKRYQSYHIEMIKLIGFLEFILNMLDEKSSDHASTVGKEIRQAIDSLENSIFDYMDVIERKIKEKSISRAYLMSKKELELSVNRCIGATDESVEKMIHKDTGISPSNQRKHLKKAWILQRKLKHEVKSINL